MVPSLAACKRGLLTSSLALSLPVVASAQDSAAELADLKKRVADLEAKTPKSAADDDIVNWSELSGLGSRFKLYGYLRLDMIYDDSRPNNTQLPAYIRSEDPTAPASVRSKSNNSDFNMHPKLTRLGLDFTGPVVAGLGDAQVLGKLEVDFYNATATESREALRMRLGYAQLKWTDFNLYAGQLWDLISPLYPIVNPDFVMWGAGNLGDRRPQLRGEYVLATGTSSKLTIAGMAGATGADDAQDLDPAGTTGAGYRDGDQSGQPTWQGRIGWKMPIPDRKNAFEAGFWVHHASEETDTPVGTNRNFVSGVYGIDLTVPVWEDTVWIKGELWHGRNLDDIRGGILQGINAAGDEVRSTGGFGEIGWKTCERVTWYGGLSFDNPDNDDLNRNSGSRSRNQIAYTALRFDFKPIYFGLDYLRWVTGYVDADRGTDNRLQAFIQYSF